MTDEQMPTLSPGQPERQNVESLWEVADVVAFTKLSESTIRRRLADESIPFRRIGGRVRFIPDEIRRWVSEQPTAREAV